METRVGKPDFESGFFPSYARYVQDTGNSKSKWTKRIEKDKAVGDRRLGAFCGREKYKRKKQSSKRERATKTVTKITQSDPELEKKKESQKWLPNQIQEQFSSSKRSSPASVRQQRRKKTGKPPLIFPSAFRDHLLHVFECCLIAVDMLWLDLSIYGMFRY